MRRILLGCTLMALGLLLGVQVANAQEPGPPQSKLVPIPSEFDTSNAKLVDTDNVIYLLTKDVYRREIYSVATAPQPRTKYAVKETKWVDKPVAVPLWYEVSPLSEAPTAKWKYEIKR